MMDKTRILRIWSYVRRGHSTYLVFMVSLANFIVIQYRLLVEYIPVLHLLFREIWLFALSFIIVYIPLAAFIGWMDYRRLAVPVDMALMARANPWVRDLSMALILMADGRYEEAKRILRRWAMSDS